MGLASDCSDCIRNDSSLKSMSGLSNDFFFFTDRFLLKSHWIHVNVNFQTHLKKNKKKDYVTFKHSKYQIIIWYPTCCNAEDPLESLIKTQGLNNKLMNGINNQRINQKCK